MTKPPEQSKPHPTVPGKRHNKPMAVGGVLAKRLEALGLEQDVVIAKLLTHWQALCPLLAHVTQPVSCTKGNLKVATKSDSVKQELRYHAPALIALINQLLGFNGVNKITAATGPFTPIVPPSSTPHPSPKPPPSANLASVQNACEGVADPELREALSRLGRWCPEESKTK